MATPNDIMQTVKKGGRNHYLFILNGIQLTLPSIRPHQNLSNEINLGLLENRITA